MYQKTEIRNPFGAPVYYIPETRSTMTDARILAARGEPDGTAVFAGFQSSGRGRVEGRRWDSASGENLLCTVILRRVPVPGFTLRVGLAVARTFEQYLGTTAESPGGNIRIKWPNDVLCNGKKLAGVICENDGPFIYVGAGLNIGQKVFPPDLAEKAASLAGILAETAGDLPAPCPDGVLSVYLDHLKAVLEMPDWNRQITERLYQRNERIRFLAGDPGKGEILDGRIEGIGIAGELLFRTGDGVLRNLYSGEIPF